jgi:hypothetical protein
VKRFFDGRRRDEKELHTGTDAAHGAASGERNTSGGSLSQAGDHRTNLLQVKRRVAGMGIAELARLRQLEDENKKLKALVADLTLDKHMLQEVLRKKF